MEEKDEIVISLSDVWNIIKKNAAFIIVVTLICAIGSFFITRYFIPKSYTSSIQLYVDTSNDDENKNNISVPPIFDIFLESIEFIENSNLVSEFLYDDIHYFLVKI